MRILFVVTGFGYGDSIRTDTIIDEIKDESRFMILGYGHSYEHFKDRFTTLKFKGYNTQESSLELKTHRFLVRNFYLPASWLLTLGKYKNRIREFNPDIIISDFEPIANLIARLFKKRLISIFSYNPQEYRSYPKKNQKLDVEAKFIEKLYSGSDLVIVPSFFKNKDCQNIRYVSPLVRHYKKETPKSVLMDRLKLKKEPILVMLGGSNFGFSLGKEIAKLQGKFDEDFILFGAYKQLPSYHFAGFKENFLDYLRVSKAVITLAGNLTLSECIAFKKPMLIFPIKNHVEQLLNAYSLRNVAMVKYNLSNLQKTVEKFLENNDKLGRKVSQLGIKAEGARQVRKILNSLL